MAAAKLLQRVEITIRSFYIFNSVYGRKDGEEHKKILYYYPDDIELNTKIRDVGLIEAIIAFSRLVKNMHSNTRLIAQHKNLNFQTIKREKHYIFLMQAIQVIEQLSGTFTSTENDCKALHTQKTTQIFYQPELGYWMVLVLNVPKEIRSKDGVEVADYRGGEVHDGIYRNILKQCYKTFQLLNGTFHMQVALSDEQQALQQLQEQLKSFFDQHINTLKVPVTEVIDLVRSIQYLPLEKLLFLRAHNLKNTICATFPLITDALLLYNEQIICSGKLNPTDLLCLHDYIFSNLLQATSSSTTTYENGAFICGAISNDGCVPAPRVHLLDEAGALRAYYLNIYRALNVTVCLLTERDSLPAEFYAELQSNIGPHLSSLSSDIADMLSRKSEHVIKNSKLPTMLSSNSNTSTFGSMFSKGGSCDVAADAITPKYIFINEHSLKHLSNLPIAERRNRQANRTPAASLPSNILNLIADRFEHDSNALNNTAGFEEVQLKTTNDFWIVRRSCNSRQYYVIIFNNKATLLDVTIEAKNIFEQELTDDVFFDD